MVNTDLKHKTVVGGTFLPIASPARQLLTFGRGQGWNPKVLGKAPLPISPVRMHDWLIIPAQQDTSPIPGRAMARIQSIYAAGLRPAGFVLVHEAPKLLPAGTRDVAAENLRLGRLSPQFTAWIKNVLKAMAGIFGVLAVATGTLILAILAAALILPAILLVGVLAIDPILVAVSEDGYWIEIDRWMTE
ncbi:MAG: hypothetical protein IH859_00180 [Chloroflexi bacterium]|nr:hypothetical protein [Chloroflexota bacterium]